MNTIIYNNIELKYIIIKKNTILFRTIYGDSKYSKINPLSLTKDKLAKIYSNNILRDFYGKQENLDDYCLSPFYNIFLYPNPYFADTNLWFNNKCERNVAIYKTQQDIKLLSFIDSKYLISDPILETNGIIKNCSQLDFCNYKMYNSNYCLTQEFMETYPDILGLYNIVEIDNNHLKEKTNKMAPFMKFMNFEKNITNTINGIPEISLYHLKMRKFITIKTKYNKNPNYFHKLYEKIVNNIDDYNLFLIEFIAHQPYKIDKLFNFMKNKLKKTPDGFFVLR